MRAKGYKCSNVKCDRCAWHSMCGELGDAALNCVDRIITIQTNADSIRSMDDEELAEFLIDLADDGNLRIREWLQQPSE